VIKPIVNPQVRNDSAGEGHFGASRGGRKHNGIDFVCTPEDFCFSPVAGEVTKLGYPYGDDLRWRYVEITDDRGLRHRLFYVSPAVDVGDNVRVGDIVGEAQDISLRYPAQGMTPHVHYEVMDSSGEFLDPGR